MPDHIRMLVRNIRKMDEVGHESPSSMADEIKRLRLINDDMCGALIAIRAHYDAASEDEATSAQTMRAIAHDVLYRHRVPNTAIDGLPKPPK